MDTIYLSLAFRKDSRLCTVQGGQPCPKRAVLELRGEDEGSGEGQIE